MNRLAIAMTALILAWHSPPATASQKKGKEVVQNIEARFEPATAKPGDTVTWKLTVTLLPHWHTYTNRQIDPDSSNITEITFRDKPELPALTTVIDPEAGSMENPEGGAPLRVLEGTFTWERSYKVSPQAANGPLKLAATARMQVCDDKHCLPADRFESTATLNITGGTSPPVATEKSANPPTVTDTNGTPADSSAYKKSLETILANLERHRAPASSGLLAFLLTAMFWGGISLLTPCVFPMIPITVSFFLKKSEKNNANPVLLALVYCGTIVVVLGAASLTLLGFFTALSINPWMNVMLGVLFVVLALSLFGMFDLTLTRFSSLC